MEIIETWQRMVALAIIGSHRWSFGNVLIDESNQVARTSTGHRAQSEPPGIDEFLERHAAVVFLFVLRRPEFGVLSQPDFDCTNDNGLVVDAADEAFINFDGIFAADLVALRSNHACAQLVEDLERCFVAAKAKLTLKLQRGLTGRLGRDQIRAPEPCGKRRVCGLHDGVCGQRSIDLALSTP